VRQGLILLSEYVDVVHTYYAGESRELDFQNAAEEARQTINSWIAKKTSGKIEELIETGDLSPITEVVLTNALHFKKSWDSRFSADSTKVRPFKVSADKMVQVPMMYQRSEFGFARGEGFQILSMPFDGGGLSMVIVLPDKADGLADLEKKLSVRNLKAWVGKLTDQKVGVFIPRFKLSSRFALESTLAAMGMPDAFSSEKADFSGMTGWKGLFIDRVVHQAVIEVDEEGAEAAAGSAVMMKKGGSAFHADRPFLFLIRDDSTGSVLFLGRVVDPTA
jgi:serpin B